MLTRPNSFMSGGMTFAEAANFTHLRRAGALLYREECTAERLTVDFLAIPRHSVAMYRSTKSANSVLEGTTSPSEAFDNR